MTLILSNEDAEELVTMPECIAALEQTYRELALGQAANPMRSDAVTPTSQPDTYYLLKMTGGVVPSLGVGVVRLNSDVGTVINNRKVKRALAPGNRYTGLILLFSSETGEPLAIFPDGILQRMRVGAASALGAKYLARSDSKVVAVIGAGWQAGGQVMAITATHNINEIRCYSPTRDKREAFCKEMSERTGVTVKSVDTPEAAVDGADIVLCATNSSKHVFSESWLRPGMHVGTIRGAELEPGVVKRADIIAVHDRTRASVVTTHGLAMPKTRHAIPEMQDLIDKAPSISDLILGTAPGRSSPQQISCFLNLVGIGLQFAAVGSVFYKKALAAGRGHSLPSEWFTEDVVP